jgi:hypothetical protein
MQLFLGSGPATGEEEGKGHPRTGSEDASSLDIYL